MLVLALEFSRGCTAHAGVGNHAAREQLRSGTSTRPGHTRGAWSPPAHVDAGTRAGRLSELEELPKGSTQHGHLTRPRGSHEHRWDVTGTDPMGRSLKTE